MGLKATNAFWNPRYYDPLTPTITKQLIYINTKQLLDEVRSLVWLGLITNRSVIIPNILGSDKIPGDTIEKYLGQSLWPGFRVLFLKRKAGKTIIPINILEPAFYWRISKDYESTPEPEVLFFDPSVDNMESILKMVQESSNIPRIVLHASRSSNVHPNNVVLGENNKRWGNDRTPPDKRGLLSSNRHRNRRLKEKLSSDLILKDYFSVAKEGVKDLSRHLSIENGPSDSELESMKNRVALWSKDSVGIFSRPFDEELKDYGIIPSVKAARQLSAYIDKTSMVINEMRTCEGIFAPLKGNRTCFQICD